MARATHILSNTVAERQPRDARVARCSTARHSCAPHEAARGALRADMWLRTERAVPRDARACRPARRHAGPLGPAQCRVALPGPRDAPVYSTQKKHILRSIRNGAMRVKSGGGKRQYIRTCGVASAMLCLARCATPRRATCKWPGLRRRVAAKQAVRACLQGHACPLAARAQRKSARALVAE